jgi:hypothetical protein
VRINESVIDHNKVVFHGLIRTIFTASSIKGIDLSSSYEGQFKLKIVILGKNSTR